MIQTDQSTIFLRHRVAQADQLTIDFQLTQVVHYHAEPDRWPLFTQNAFEKGRLASPKKSGDQGNLHMRNSFRPPRQNLINLHLIRASNHHPKEACGMPEHGGGEWHLHSLHVRTFSDYLRHCH